MSVNSIKKTALFDHHIKLNAKMTSFGGFEMPISYPKGIKSEYFAVRENAGLFDVSHMGELIIEGKNSVEFLQKTTINNIKKLQVGHAQYSAILNHKGGIIDDLIILRKKNEFLLVVNAANTQKDYYWLKKNLIKNVKIKDVSNQTSLIALQGPRSRFFLSHLTEIDLMMPFYTFKEGTICEMPVLLSRTGYTGELGFEIYGNKEAIIIIWEKLLKLGVEPTGLAARDILRMEMKYCLYGNDIDEKTNPIEAGLSWITSLDKGSFIGYEKIQEEKEKGPYRKLVSFEMQERAIPRSGYAIYIESKKIGIVTSGTQSPLLNNGIGLAYIDAPFNRIGQKISISIRDRLLDALIIQPPFLNETSLLK